MLKNKKILLGISGGIAAYKCPELIRQLIAEQAEVKVIATESALEFVTTVTLQTVSRNKVYSEVFEPISDFNPRHISHADWGDILLVAPATANIIGKFACGITCIYSSRNEQPYVYTPDSTTQYKTTTSH